MAWPETVDDVLARLFEELASIEHERWSHWQIYMHSKGDKQSDGSLILPADLVDQWERQATTPFGGLSEREKNSDREQVNRYLPLIAAALKTAQD